MFNLRSSKQQPETPAPPTNNSGVKAEQAASPTTNASASDAATPATTKDAAKDISPDEARRRAIRSVRRSLAFGQIIGQLMRSPLYKHYTLADLEWLVLPPLMAGQFAIGQANAEKDGPRIPAAVALWASVSPEVDARLIANPNAAIRLQPGEWRSGDILWLVAVAGDPRVLPKFLEQLGQTTFKDRPIKVRRRSQDGKVTVGGLPKSTSPAQ